MSEEDAEDAALRHMSSMLAFHGRTLDQFKGMKQPPEDPATQTPEEESTYALWNDSHLIFMTYMKLAAHHHHNAANGLQLLHFIIQRATSRPD